MPFSHHSHSGQFCPGHARNTLEEMVQAAITCNMAVFAVTEHMPRESLDFYPEETETDCTEELLVKFIDDFYVEATRLREKYSSQIDILIGFEAEWIRPSSLKLVEELLTKHQFDLFIGSVHYVHTIPIDYDETKYQQARKIAGGTDENLFGDYFDAQYDMLAALRPPVVGHFDLIRLYSDEPDRPMKDLEGVWQKILRNLGFIARYGGLLELNSSALRKGMASAYPAPYVCQAFLALGGRFCLSDDSHGVEQVGLNYARMLDGIHEAGITSLHYLHRKGTGVDERFPATSAAAIHVAALEDHRLFKLSP